MILTFDPLTQMSRVSFSNTTLNMKSNYNSYKSKLSSFSMYTCTQSKSRNYDKEQFQSLIDNVRKVSNIMMI